jgi:hypothetical protein
VRERERERGFFLQWDVDEDGRAKRRKRKDQSKQ